FDRIGQLGVLVLRLQAVVDELLVGRVLLELGRAFTQVARLPEALTDALRLVHDLLLLEQLREQDVEGDDRHQHEDREDRLRDEAAFLQSGLQAELVFGCRGAAGRENGGEHLG
ncbi:hypothetical protein LS48_14650, partial [Aequorivita aquimaris]